MRLVPAQRMCADNSGRACARPMCRLTRYIRRQGMKRNTVMGMALATAAAAMFVTGMGVGNAQDDGSNVVKIRCFGGNACKGQSDCKTTTNECRGHNACKGEGVEFRGIGTCASKPGRQ